MNNIIYYVIITLYLYSANSFSSNGKYIYCTYIVYHTSFLPSSSSIFLLSNSLPLSSHPVSSLPLFLCPFQTFLNTRPSRFTIYVYLSYADIESSQIGQSAEIQIVKFTLFKRYCFYAKSHILFQALKC